MFLPDIRFCTIKDLDRIMRVEERSFDSPWPRDLIRRDLSGDTAAIYLGAFGGDIMLGYAALFPCERSAELASIAVLPEYQRRGVASQLLLGISEVAAALGYGRLCLHVKVTSEGARSFYEKYGFTTIMLKPGYYEGGADALLMESELPLKI
ncbi:MAG: ribosomal protein S18-alanine N-acetyltransferase [Synergistota bacterium]|nr:ribosomal protein S18-alanine N-acetyltransferase [Synergistota bacterium]